VRRAADGLAAWLLVAAIGWAGIAWIGWLLWQQTPPKAGFDLALLLEAADLVAELDRLQVRADSEEEDGEGRQDRGAGHPHRGVVDSADRVAGVDPVVEHRELLVDAKDSFRELRRRGLRHKEIAPLGAWHDADFRAVVEPLRAELPELREIIWLDAAQLRDSTRATPRSRAWCSTSPGESTFCPRCGSPARTGSS
jgi:hypothetical protein